MRGGRVRCTFFSGDTASAEALIAATPLDCYLCVRVRGQIAAIKHDWPSAERWFSEAVRQAPSLPFAPGKTEDLAGVYDVGLEPARTAQSPIKATPKFPALAIAQLA